MTDPVASVIIRISEPIGIGLSGVIASALEQSVGTPEVIIVTRPALFTGEVEAEILRRGDSLRYYLCQENLPPGALLQTGVDAARGQYITWMTADDTYDPRKLELQITAIGSSGSGCVTCGSGLIGQSIPPPPADLSNDRASVVQSLLERSRDPATLLVSRDLLDQAGGFDPGFSELFELDLAIRLALRFPFAHVPTMLVQRNIRRPERQGDRQEIQRIADRVLDTTPIDNLPTLGQIVFAFGEDIAATLPAVRRRVAALVKNPDLVIGIPEAANNPAEAMGVPGAGVIGLSSTQNYQDALAQALAKSSAERLVVIDPAAPPQPDTFAVQLLRSSTGQLDACLPVSDPLIYTPTPTPPSLIPGTLFKRSALEKMLLGGSRTEAQFWAALSKTGRIGALPAAGPIPRRTHSPPSQPAAPAPFRTLPANLVVALIDQEWYAAMNPALAAMNVHPVDHFLNIGWRERLHPNPWFHTAWYLAKNPDVLERNMNPLEHFVLEGARRGCHPSPGFDIEWYSRHYLDAEEPCAEALLHFMTIGLARGVIPYPRLRTQTPALSSSVRPMPPVVRSQEPENNQQLLDALANAEWFDTQWYLSQNPDAQNTDPLAHFVSTGARRGRKPCPFFDISWYARHYLAQTEPTAEALWHFLTIGLAAGAVPQARLATPAIRKRLLQIPVQERSALIKRLQNLLAQTLADGSLPQHHEAGLWPLLLAEHFPPDVSAVLLVCEHTPEAFGLLEAAGIALPLDEFPIFGLVDPPATLRITNCLEQSAISLTLRMPEQSLMLGDLLNALNCQRAAIVGPHQLHTPVARMIRQAGVPLFRNGPNPVNGDKRWTTH